MKRRPIMLITVFILAIASGSVAVHGQEAEGEDDALSDVDRAVAAVLLESISSSLDESRDPIVDALAAAGEDPEALAQAYNDLAFWSLMYAQGVKVVGLPAGVQPLVDDLVSAHGDFSAAAESLAADPTEASLLAAYLDAEQARLASVDALYEALGLTSPGQDADSVDQDELDGPSPSLSA
jgi:hypothetical protein